MKDFNTIEEIIDFAIAEEVRAARFYRDLAAKATNEPMRMAFEEFAKEEDGHKEKLLKVKAGDFLPSVSEKVQDLKIADYLVEIDPEEGDMNYAKALVIAMNKEKAAYKMYLNLSEKVDNEELSATFLELANEEARHKLRFEIEYDDNVLKDW